MKTYRVAVVGGGGIAVEHLKGLREQERFVAVAVAEVNEERGRAVAAEYGIAAYTDYKEMIEREKPDVAVVTLPHFLHKEAAVFCVEHGCHVLLEKPMAMNVAECDAIIAAVERSGAKLFVGHTQHYIAENRAAKKLIASGDLGELVMINDCRHVSYFTDKRPKWFLQKALAGGGILTNLGSHSIDKIQWLAGAPFVSVKASVSYRAPEGDIEGSGLVFATNANGVPATISQSGYSGVYKDETEFFFTKGSIKLMTGRSLWISEGGEYVQVPVEREGAWFALQFADLLAYIEEGKEPECSMAYARSVVAAVEAVYRSHESGAETAVAG
ncbi:Gfo/Idh/MocA family protein [Paenibacillus cymbidii]|uniref:Gfo/Idh/MocA family protein n=1 Tax=Paenibacillus cymbidii TaxID=1639034 RepID=UPI00108182C5|nr:Gfo/Idh/MocA family oxidoreductase [Paenibacillus cymbidii]